MVHIHVRRLALVVLFALQQFACTGRPSPFAGRRVIRLGYALRDRLARLVEDKRAKLADGLIRLADRLVPLPQAQPIVAFAGATPSEPVRVPAPSIEPVPTEVWEEVERSQAPVRQRPRRKLAAAAQTTVHVHGKAMSVVDVTAGHVPTAKEMEGLSVRQLRVLAKLVGCRGYSRMRREDLIKAIRCRSRNGESERQTTAVYADGWEGNGW
jgi:hypothetical protein